MMTRIGEQIKKARTAKGMTQDALAEAVHVTRPTISHWENGRYVPDFDMIQRLSKILQCQFTINDDKKQDTVETEVTAPPLEEEQTAERRNLEDIA